MLIQFEDALGTVFVNSDRITSVSVIPKDGAFAVSIKGDQRFESAPTNEVAADAVVATIVTAVNGLV